MTFSKKKLPKCQLEITVQLTSEELSPYRAKATSELAKDLRLEGFRSGHVPVSIAEKHVGEAAILEKAANAAIGEAWGSIVRQEGLEVIGEPEVQVLKLTAGNPLEFRVRVAELPEISLPDYKKIANASSRKRVLVEEKEVDKALQWLRESRKSKDGVSPEATNEFAKSIGNFSDLASLRESIKEGLRAEKDMQEKDRLRQEIIENIAKQSKFEIPDVLVEREKRVLLSQMKQGVDQVLGMQFAEYTKKAGKTEQELLESFGPEAERRVRRFLVVREVAKKEGIGPSKEEVEQEADSILKHYSSAPKKVDPARLKEYTEGVLRHEKTLQFLEQFAS